jgi:hypothetical protein
MKKSRPKQQQPGATTPGQEIAASLREAIAWAHGDAVPVGITRVELPTVDVRVVRRKLRLSQSNLPRGLALPQPR